MLKSLIYVNAEDFQLCAKPLIIFKNISDDNTLIWDMGAHQQTLLYDTLMEKSEDFYMREKMMQ